MKKLLYVTSRNIKLFFCDKGMFFTSLITPLILLVLYATFLSNVYRDSFSQALPDFLSIDEELLDSTVAAQLLSSLLSVCCITVAFCSNMLCVQDKSNATRQDLLISPIKTSTLSLGYFFATLFTTLIICFITLAAGLVYLWSVGWYLAVEDVFLIILDVVLLVLLGTSLSSIVAFFLSTQGQISAVGAVISAGYGFICGAYMPMSQFSEGLRRVLSFLPFTYGTSLIRNHTMDPSFDEMISQGFPTEAVKALRDTVDCNIYFFDEPISVNTMYLVVSLSVIVFIFVYVLLNVLLIKRKK